MGQGLTRQRVAGVLLHPTSLPSGRLDADAYRWIDWLAQAGFRVWQMLPLGVPLIGLSPYQCASAFAVNPALFAGKEADHYDAAAFRVWYESQRHWVDDYALFMALKQQLAGQTWLEWPTALRHREPQAIAQARRTHAAAINRLIQEQYRCYDQWQNLRQYAASRGITLFGDMPIFVAHDSADVWSHPELFLLNAAGEAEWVAGVPPDYFSETGQRWGNPHYCWERMAQTDFQWWRQRLEYHVAFFDLVRIDHFRGLAASWMIPASEPTAINGYWQTVPGDAMLASIQAALGDLPLVAEDLGVITPDVIALRDKYALPGMSVLQFSFDHFEDNLHKPQNVRENTVYYTGTHDNDTLLGWFNHLDAAMQQHVLQSLNITDVADLTTAMLDTVFASNAWLALVPLQDLLQLDSTARMNTPGTIDGNWQWGFQWSQLPENLASVLKKSLLHHQRLGNTPP